RARPTRARRCGRRAAARRRQALSSGRSPKELRRVGPPYHPGTMRALALGLVVLLIVVALVTGRCGGDAPTPPAERPVDDVATAPPSERSAAVRQPDGARSPVDAAGADDPVGGSPAAAEILVRVVEGTDDRPVAGVTVRTLGNAE